MDRQIEVLKHITKMQRGIEVGPWFNPLAPKRDGYNCLTLDVFDTETLKETARMDPNVANVSIDFIESVDMIGTSTEIGDVVKNRGELGSFDYVISSHNFEHLPNPIKFLQGCGVVLKKDGFLSMAIPDSRVCFDYFRPHSTLGLWIEAFFADRDRPSFTQVFEQNSLHSRYEVGDELRGAFSLTDDPRSIIALKSLKEAYETWKSRAEAKDSAYYDTHCWMFTPSSLHLLLADCHFLGISPFSIDEVSEVNGHEFYAHLRNTGYIEYDEIMTDAYYKHRQSLLHSIRNETSKNSIETFLFKQPETLRDSEDDVWNLKKEIDRQNVLIEKILLSRSWRITAVLRKLKNVLVRTSG